MSADDFVPTEELARRQGFKSITSVDDPAAEVDTFARQLAGNTIAITFVNYGELTKWGVHHSLTSGFSFPDRTAPRRVEWIVG